MRAAEIEFPARPVLPAEEFISLSVEYRFKRLTIQIPACAILAVPVSEVSRYWNVEIATSHL